VRTDALTRARIVEADIDETVAEIGLFREKHPPASGSARQQATSGQHATGLSSRRERLLSSSVGPDAFVKALELVMAGETILLWNCSRTDRHRGSDELTKASGPTELEKVDVRAGLKGP